MRTFLLLLLAVFTLVQAACGAGDSARRGAEGEVCFEDLDCRAPLVCGAGQCRGVTSASDTSGGATGGDGASAQAVCSVFCEQLGACDFSMPESCMDSCLEIALGWSDAARGELLACVVDAACDLDAIDDCISDVEGQAPGPGSEFRFVLLEDLSDEALDGPSPGSDIDAVSVVVDGVERFATTVEDFSIGGPNNNNVNVTELLGAPDARCVAENYVSLGGALYNGFVIVGFSSGGREVTFRSGDPLTVYELGPSLCPQQPDWVDESVRVGVSVSTSRSNFVEVGETRPGLNTLTIP